MSCCWVLRANLLLFLLIWGGFGKYGQFQAEIGGLLGRMGCFVSRSWDYGNSTFLLFARGLSLTGLRTAVFISEGEPAGKKILPPPHYGEHTEMVLKRFLNLEDESIQELIKDGVIDGMGE